MTKAILILDNVDETEIAELRANVQLNLYGEDRGEYNNCPLKPMPQKKVIDYETFEEDGQKYAYEVGFNDCVNELVGEDE